LPYSFEIDDTVVGSRGGADGGAKSGIAIKISNVGSVGAAFSVHNYGPSNPTPMQYTIEAGRALTSTWTDAGYNISLHGPNGFVRKFSGNASAAAAAAVSFREVGGATAPGTEAVVLSMQPFASALADVRGCSVSVEVRDNEYTHGGPWTFALSNTAAQGGGQQQQQQHRVQTASSGNWYDLTATTVLTCGGGSPSAATYSRRYMGKVETVHATSTDPAMAKGTPADAGSATHPTIPDAVRKLMQDGARATHPAAAKVEGGAGAVGSCPASTPNKDACYNNL